MKMLEKSVGYLSVDAIEHYLSYFSPFAIVKKESDLNKLIDKFKDYAGYYSAFEKYILFDQDLSISGNEVFFSYLPENMRNIYKCKNNPGFNNESFYNITKEITKNTSSIYYYYLHIVNCVRLEKYDELYDLSKKLINNLTLSTSNLFQNKMIYIINVVCEKMNEETVEISEERLKDLWENGLFAHQMRLIKMALEGIEQAEKTIKGHDYYIKKYEEENKITSVNNFKKYKKTSESVIEGARELIENLKKDKFVQFLHKIGLLPGNIEKEKDINKILEKIRKNAEKDNMMNYYKELERVFKY